MAVVCRPQKRLGVQEEFPLPICNNGIELASMALLSLTTL